MKYGMIPDLAAMAVLIAILLLLRRRHPKKSGRSLAPRPGLYLHRGSGSASSTTQSSCAPASPVARRRARCPTSSLDWSSPSAGATSPSAAEPLLLYCRQYHSAPCGPYALRDGQLQSRPVPRLLASPDSSSASPARWPFAVDGLSFWRNLAGWSAMAWFVTHGTVRQAAYWELFCLYVLAAFAFQKSLPAKSAAGLPSSPVSSFGRSASSSIPGSCIIRSGRTSMNQIWNMQKFLISIGMLIVMLEDQITSNEWLALHDQPHRPAQPPPL